MWGTAYLTPPPLPPTSLAFEMNGVEPVNLRVNTVAHKTARA